MIDRLQSAIHRATRVNSEIQVKPDCILWPDPDHQWEAALPQLQEAFPEMLVLGDYAPDSLKGPALWLRCAIAGVLEGIALPSGKVPILYLPGVGRTELRAVENCPEPLKPLAELQYRGIIWSQQSAKDWTPLAFIKSKLGGLGLEIASDQDTRNALVTAIDKVLELDVSALDGKRLDSHFFNSLMTSGDLAKDFLEWLDQGENFVQQRSEAAWYAFNEICKFELSFTPKDAGLLSGAERLAAQDGPWSAIWQRFCEAPKRYKGIPILLRKCELPSFDLLTDISVKSAWPQWNDDEEKKLNDSLLSIAELPVADAREAVFKLEAAHADRRKCVWAQIGQAQLACSLEHLTSLAKQTETALAGGTISDLEKGYTTLGWTVDNAALESLALVNNITNAEAVSTVLRAIYLPWLEASAKHLQDIFDPTTYPRGNCETAPIYPALDSECVLFVDGLRLDLGKRLSARIKFQGLQVAETNSWSALPSVTATAKPAVSPVVSKIKGADSNVDFEPSVADSGKSLKGGYHLKQLLGHAGYEILKGGLTGDVSKKGWAEFGDIDHIGHQAKSWKFAQQIETILDEITERVAKLLQSGWKSVRIVTDHGWLLMPGGLPKVELSSALSENKWGRCASIKTGAKTDNQLFPWYWNASEEFALARGVSCFQKGHEYTHGGLSLQECLTLELSVNKLSDKFQKSDIKIVEIVWTGLRCKVVRSKSDPNLNLDVRKNAGDGLSSHVYKIKSFGETDTTSVVVENEDLEGQKATVVILDKNGNIVTQSQIIIGGES